MISELTTNPELLQKLFDRLNVGYIIFEASNRGGASSNDSLEQPSLQTQAAFLHCTAANDTVRRALHFDPIGDNYTLIDWMNDFPEVESYLKICERGGEVQFIHFYEDLGYKGKWVSSEYEVHVDAEGYVTSLIGIFKDISQEKRLEKKLSLNQNKLKFAELILDISQKLAHIGTWRLDLKTRNLTGTDTLFKIFDIPIDTKNLYQDYLSRIHPADLANFTSTFENAVQTGSSYIVQHRAIKPNGRVIYVSGNGHPILSSDGEVVGYFGLFQDISDLKHAQIELEKANRGLEDKVKERTHELEMSSQKMQVVLQQLQRQNEQLQQYTYIVSHNLRAPVANITGLSELFDFENSNSEQNHKIISHIYRVSRHLDQIIMDLNEILSAEGAIHEAISPLNLRYEIDRVCDELSQEIKRQNAQISINLEEGVEVPGVRGYLFSILHNLLENSLKYHQGDRELLIEIGAKLSDEGYFLWVEDNGMGIDLSKDYEKIFKLNARLDDEIEKGKGMGLYLVKSHVEQLGGKINVESELGEGSRFEIFLPF